MEEELFWNGFCFFVDVENGFFSLNVLEDVSGVVSNMDGVGEISEGSNIFLKSIFLEILKLKKSNGKFVTHTVLLVSIVVSCCLLD